jgi:uncharacterized membrane protein YgcG
MKLNRLIAVSIVAISLLTTSTSAFASEHNSWSWFGLCSHTDREKDKDCDHERNHERDHDRDHDHDGGHDCNHGGSTGSGGGSTSGGGGSVTPPVGPKG